MKKDFMEQYKSMAEHNTNVTIRWNEYDDMKIERVTRHRRYVELIVIDSEGELHYLKCTNREFVNLILDGGY